MCCCHETSRALRKSRVYMPSIRQYNGLTRDRRISIRGQIVVKKILRRSQDRGKAVDNGAVTPRYTTIDVHDCRVRTDECDRGIMLANWCWQAMSVPNREYVARQVDALETILRIAQRAKTDSRLLKPVTGIIGCLFKESEEVDICTACCWISYKS